MKWMSTIIFLLSGAIILILLCTVVRTQHRDRSGAIPLLPPDHTSQVSSSPQPAAPVSTPPLSPSPLPMAIPTQHIIPQRTHTFQTFNNCGPASLSMALSYVGVTASQQELGQRLRPYQVPGGDNDDKSTTLPELAAEAERRGLVAYYRPNGSPQILQRAIAKGLPVIVRTWLSETEAIGHYRVIRGYDQTTQEYIQDDSLQGANLRYSFDELDQIWRAFNSEYLIIAPPERRAEVEAIIGEDLNTTVAWQATLERVENELENNPTDVYAKFNQSVAAYHLNDYQKSIEAYEAVANQLPFRMLWYQIEPIQAYYHAGQHNRVISITDQILNGGNRAFSELYVLRAQVFSDQGETERAQQELELADRYHPYWREHGLEY